MRTVASAFRTMFGSKWYWINTVAVLLLWMGYCLPGGSEASVMTRLLGMAFGLMAGGMIGITAIRAQAADEMEAERINK